VILNATTLYYFKPVFDLALQALAVAQKFAVSSKAARNRLSSFIRPTTTMITSAENEIPLLEHAWMVAWVEHDLATCERILADDFMLTSARGVLMPKLEWLTAAMSAFNCTAFTWEELLVRPFGDVAIVHGRSTQQASVAGRDWSGVFLVTDVRARRNNQWQVVSRHGTGPLSA